MPAPHTASENHEDPRSHALPFVHAAAGSGEALDVVGDLLVLRTEPTQEAPMLAVETTVPPGGGPPPHTHAADELFLVRAYQYVTATLDLALPTEEHNLVICDDHGELLTTGRLPTPQPLTPPAGRAA